MRAADAGDEAATWFSELLGNDCRLVAVTSETNRTIGLVKQQPVTFVDAGPVLVANTASHAFLEQRANEPFTIERFRPNLVVATDTPWIEDTWKTFAIGAAELTNLLSWPRCTVPQIDQDTGERAKEPGRCPPSSSLVRIGAGNASRLARRTRGQSPFRHRVRHRARGHDASRRRHPHRAHDGRAHPRCPKRLASLRIVLVEPWFGGSHRSWAEGYAKHSAHDVELLTLPPEGWKWRLRGGAVALAQAATKIAPPDLILASSMLDLAAFLGLARRRVGTAPAVLYMHENQLTYPLQTGRDSENDVALVNWRSMVAADLVAFNSEFHRASFFAALPLLLRDYPPPRHTEDVQTLYDKTTVLPIGIAAPAVSNQHLEQVPLVLWNHRWEHDKGLELFSTAMCDLARFGSELSARRLRREADRDGMPRHFERLRAELEERIVHFGFAAGADYERLLGAADIVVSTATHDFFGRRHR